MQQAESKYVDKRRTVAVFLLFIGLLCAGFFISITNGSAQISMGEVMQSFFGQTESLHRKVILNIRLPRTILAILVGVNLSLAGIVLQAIMRNPLADPGIIGVSSGAGLFGVVVLILFPKLNYMLPPVTFIGAMVACALVYALSWKNGLRPIRIILAGIAVSAFFGAGISGLMIFYADRVQGALLFLSGNLSGSTWKNVFTILPYTLIGSVLIFLQRQKLNLLLLGEETASSLGLDVNRERFLLTALASIMAASAVSVVGLLGFVGLIVPHTTRLLLGSNHLKLIPGGAILGGAVLLLSDTFARNILRPVEIPVGIIMALVGAPFFLMLLRKNL